MRRTNPKRTAAILAAKAKGRMDYAEGVPGNLPPFTDQGLAQAWRTGWWTGFRDYPPNKQKREHKERA